MSDSLHLNHPYAFAAYVRLIRSDGIPYPLGTRVLNLQDELDDDDGRERITCAGHIWTVTHVFGENRSIGCEATGAAIIPTVSELDTQFLMFKKSISGPDLLLVAQRAAHDIARNVLRIPTLVAQRSDSLDFHDVAVWELEIALIRAFGVGLETGCGRTLTHPEDVVGRVRLGELDVAEANRQLSSTDYSIVLHPSHGNPVLIHTPAKEITK